ncbi:hypothetical protein EDC01DRAFT_284527 [Geopyxis carbonaria]|nr:hypothetical protein EDC01DRAFT_284527 [Geopyxis carbonaria]
MATFNHIIYFLLLALTASAAVIPNSWIVYLKSDASLEAHLTWLKTQDNTGYKGIAYEWNNPDIIVGYSGEFAPKVISAVKQRPEVENVYANNIISIDDPVGPSVEDPVSATS